MTIANRFFRDVVAASLDAAIAETIDHATKGTGGIDHPKTESKHSQADVANVRDAQIAAYAALTALRYFFGRSEWVGLHKILIEVSEGQWENIEDVINAPPSSEFMSGGAIERFSDFSGLIKEINEKAFD